MKLINSDCVTKENIKDHNLNWPKIPDHPYRISVICDFRYGKINAVFNLINHKLYTNKIYVYAKDLMKQNTNF